MLKEDLKVRCQLFPRKFTQMVLLNIGSPGARKTLLLPHFDSLTSPLSHRP